VKFKKVQEPPLKLSDIWRKDQSHYLKIIEFLKEENPTTGVPFAKEIDGRLEWQQGVKGSKLYLGAFIFKCVEEGWIKHNSSRFFQSW
jgi:hypothetical protein